MVDLKIKLLLIFGFFSVFGFGQVINMELPVLSPQSPTTSELGKYGEIQVNESTGVISPSIPLFEYYAGKINLPITLSYGGNGVRVAQDPTWTGINWNLNPSGVITRVVKDKVDETTSIDQKRFLSENQLNLISGSLYRERTSDWYQMMKQIGAEAVDSEADIFNYSFPGYSGSFFLDTDGKAHLVKYDKELLITFELRPENKSLITIKTPEGDTYFFGGPDASESSKTFVNTGAGSTASSPDIQNAFYLYQISTLEGESVNFDYESYKPSGDFQKIGIQENASYSDESPCNKTVRDLLIDVENLVRLVKIRSSVNSQYVEFNNSSYGKKGGMTKLNSIFLRSNEDEILKRVVLQYLTINNEAEVLDRKFFLDKVEFYSGNNKFEYDYELTYNSPQGFPAKASFAQDDLGYYNGRNTNTTLLPKTNNADLNLNCQFGLADREADFQSSLKGSLSRIKYPTGGYSDFEYELPYKGQAVVYDRHLYMTAYFKDPLRHNESSMHAIDQIGLNTYSTTYSPEGGDAPLVITSNTTINFTLDIMAMGPFSHHNNVSLSAVNTAGQVFRITEATGRQIGTSDNELKYYTNNYSITLVPGSYVFKISVNLHSSAAWPNSINYVVANAHCILPNGLRNVYYPGLRLKSTTTYDNNYNLEKKRYYYNERTRLGLGGLINTPNYITLTRNLHSSNMYFVNAYNLSSDDLTNNFDNDLGKFTYDVVTVSYGGNNFENGGKEMHFYNQNNSSPFYYGHTYDLLWPEGTTGIPQDPPTGDIEAGCGTYVNVGTNHSYRNSTLWKEHYFDSNLKDIKKMVYNYEGTITFSMDNIKTYKYCYMTNGVLYMPYQTNSYKYRLLSTEATEFNGGNPIGVVASTFNTYMDDKVSLPSEITATTSAGVVKKTKIYYPSDVSSTHFSTLDIGYINSMGSAGTHNIAEVIRTESFLNGTLLETKQMSFGYWGGVIFPKTIKASKGANPLQPRVDFIEYSQGKPAVVSLTDGAQTKYIYNAKGQAIVKIENFDPFYPLPTGISPTDPCYYQLLYPSSMVTTYNYDNTTSNLINVVDPKCNTTHYEYNEFNKLRYIKDKDLNVLQRYCYNYEGQGVDCAPQYNVVKSGSFTRNNCPAGGIPATVVYTVPAGTYSSLLSQADADALAQADVDTNGQAYANAAGACAYSSVAMSGSFTRNNCGPNGTGSVVAFTLNAGARVSFISQADANYKASLLFATNGQNWANSKGTCTYEDLE